MSGKKPAPTATEAFLAPLARMARKHPEIEGLVFWGGAGGWDAAPSEALEAEEIVFYAEGLLIDGFHMRWAIAALPETPAIPDHIQLFFWQDDGAPPEDAGWITLESAVWTPG